MEQENKMISTLEGIISKIELDLKKVRYIVEKIKNWDSNIDDINDDWKLQELASRLLSYDDEDTTKVIEWVYDGYFMIWSDEKKYPVPLNYSSKTKLVPWDVLKLRIMQDGKLIYKLIWPCQKKYIKANLTKAEDSKYYAVTDEWETYYLNQAAVTFFKWKPWDELSIIVNAEWTWTYAAIEAVISN